MRIKVVQFGWQMLVLLNMVRADFQDFEIGKCIP